MVKKGLERFIVLYVPWLLATLTGSDPLLSYWIAWFGSFFIFSITLTGWVVPIPADRGKGEQLMRPLFILHIIFAGYMCCTSVFYLLNTLGYENFTKSPEVLFGMKEKLMLIAQCQRYYCLAHAAFISGILVFMRYPSRQKYQIDKSTIANLLFKTAIITLPLSSILIRIPGLSQFSNQFNSLSFIAGTLALAFAIPFRKSGNILICGALYLLNFYQSLISGFKEPIIISILVLGIFLYPLYKKAVLIIFLPALFFCFQVLPTYVNTFRGAAWHDDENLDDAAEKSLDAALKTDNDNWDFYVYRLSEIDMFITFVQSTPATVDFYGAQLVGQSISAIVPRVFWPSKPSTEDMVMMRVYQAGVVNPYSNVSAKPAFIVDAYLSAGAPGIFLAMFAYGAIAQVISIKAETLFGGYILGTALIFSGLFQIFWRGLSFEFMTNSVFWSFISMLIIHRFFLKYNILKKIDT